MDKQQFLTVPQVAEIKGICRSNVLRAIEHGKCNPDRIVTGRRGNGGKNYLINIENAYISPVERERYYKSLVSLDIAQTVIPAAASSGEKTACTEKLADLNCDAEFYAKAPTWQKENIDKRGRVLEYTAGLRGNKLKAALDYWNEQNPQHAVSYSTLLVWRDRRQNQGISGLVPQYGKNISQTKVTPEILKIFSGFYLKEGAPSAESCWRLTLGYAKTHDPQINSATFPHKQTFLRALNVAIPKSAIYMARYGESAWQRKYQLSIDRDYSLLKPGELYVSDHAQIDVAVELPKGDVKFPWITAWIDMKTSKYVGWVCHWESPNSDHIFQSFYLAIKNYGLPEHIYIDNGKDYRAKDFAGGRQSVINVSVDEAHVRNMVAKIGITPHFSKVYHAQTKTIERTFLTLKESFSKHMPGYRGGDVTERPEVLVQEIKTGKILHYDEFVKLLDLAIANLNEAPSEGKVLQGRSPNQVWNEELHEIKKISNDALMLFCSRTSNDLSIGKNGIQISEKGIKLFYWGEWMTGNKGKRVYMRRAPDQYNRAWVFDAANDEYIGMAIIGETSVPVLANTDIDRAKLRNISALQAQEKKINTAYARRVANASSPSDMLIYAAAGIKIENELRGYGSVEQPQQPVIRLANTEMDQVVLEERARQRIGTEDPAQFQPPERKQSKIYGLITDRDYDQNKKI